MRRILLYPVAATLIILPPQGNNTTTSGWQPHNPVVFATPFNAAEQQYIAHGNPGLVPTAVTPHGWEGQQLETRFAKPFPANEQQFHAMPAQHVPFAVDIQGFPRHWDIRFTKPYPVEQQKYSDVFTFHSIPTKVTPQGFYPQPPDAFAQPFPAAQQQFIGNFKYPDVVPPTGWWGQQLEVRFAQPFPVVEQNYTPSAEPEKFPVERYGWFGYQFEYRFTQPFPVSAQQYSGYVPMVVPPNLPPGAGKRYKKPTDYLPEPPYDAKPNKPFRPVWDKAKGGVIEQPAKPAGPPPLPPPELFGAPRPTAPTIKLGALPDFANYAPPDPMGLAQRMRDAQDVSDAMAVLKALGLLGE